MRVLVTRPDKEAARTAQALRNLGHEPVIAPLTTIERTGAPLPEGRFCAVAVTSANAIDAPDLPPRVLSLPLYAVGARTAAAAGLAGFADIRTASGTADALAALMVQQLPSHAQVLFLAGRPRKTHLEMALAGAGLIVTVAETYRAKAVNIADWPRIASVAAILHYSRASAERFATLARQAGAERDCDDVAHLCLSQDVSRGLSTLPNARIFIAGRPDEASLFELLNICRSGLPG